MSVSFISFSVVRTFYFNVDGYSDSDIMLSWQNDYVNLENKEMAQFSIKDVVLSSYTTFYPTGNAD